MTHTIFDIRKYIYTLAVAASALTFAACDEVDDADRFHEMPAQESSRNVLVEEFTGQRCTNCPDAHKALAALSEQYGSNLIVVGIHAGSFGVADGTIPGYLGLKETEGQEYADRWGDLDKVGYPVAGFDRTGKPATLQSGTWDATIYSEIGRPANLDIELSAHLTAANDIEINTTINPYANLKGKLQLWVVEDSIKAFQIDHGRTDKNYIHNHVFRSSANGTWGEDVTLMPDVQTKNTCTIAVKEGWNVDHLHIVAFVYNDKDGVLQAQKTDVVK